MNKEQEIDYLLSQIKALNKIGKVLDAKNAFATLLNYTPNSSILKEAHDSFSKGDLGRGQIQLYNSIMRHREINDK